MYPYQRATSASSTASSYQGSQHPSHQSQQSQSQSQQHQHNHHQQQQSQQQQQQQRASSVNSTGSPEQTRAHTMGRNYHVPHDDYRQPHNPSHQHQYQHHQRGLSETHEIKDQDDRGSGHRRWMDEQRSFGPPPPSSDRVNYGKQNQPPPPQHRDYASPHPSFSHPASPSHRPRTPPQQHHYGAASGHRTSTWDSAQNGPMSAPPSLVPRVNPSSANVSSTSSLPQTGPLSLHTSPILPSLMRGSKSHSRIPSWGPHSNNASNSSRTETGNNNSGSNNGNVGGSSNNTTHGQSLPPPPPPMLPFRGQSVGLGEPFMRSDLNNRDQLEKRKRPASESPPNAAGSGDAVQQSSPTQRGDPMSMSSILGPSSRNSEVEKRRRLDGGSMPPSSTYSTTIKMEGSVPTANTNSGPKITATNVVDPPASNLARRKWSGPIAEEAAQHAAAWRAQEQRWGSSRSPKIGLTNLPEQRRTPPIGNIPALKRGTSPGRGEGHKRQRSDGYQTMHESPLTRNLPLRGPSPPQGKQSHSTDSSPAGFNQSLPPMSRSGQSKQYGQQQQGGVVSFYRPGSPPQPSSQQLSKGVPPNSMITGSKPFPVSSHQYGQPSYHAYDSQGRPVEIDVEEVRGGAFAGHGNLPPTTQEQQGYRPGASFNDQRHRPVQTSSQVRPPLPTSVAEPPSKIAAAQGPMGVTPVPLPPHHQSQKIPHNSQTASRPPGSLIKERELKRRSTTPNTLGPARGLLTPRIEQRRLQDEGGNGGVLLRPAVAMKDFNQGLKVDSEAVWETLGEIQRRRYQDDEGVVLQDEVDKGLVLDASIMMSKGEVGAKTRHLGNFQYDPRKSPLLPGDLLQANIGATIEIRVSGRYLGLGPKIQDERKTTQGSTSNWSLGWRAKEQVNNGGIAPSSQLSSSKDETSESEDFEGLEQSATTFWDQDALLNRKLWGTDVYTDDSDTVAMCLHAGWIQGPLLQDVPSWVPPGKAMLAWKQMTKMYTQQGIDEEATVSRQEHNQAKDILMDRLSSTADLSVIVRIAPKLIAYKGSQRCGVKSRSWGNGHDGVSLVIESVNLKEAGYASGEKGLRNAKHRIDHLARLKTLATIAIDATMMKRNNNKSISNMAEEDEKMLLEKVQDGGLIDIRLAAKVKKGDGVEKASKPFWQIDVNNGRLVET